MVLEFSLFADHIRFSLLVDGAHVFFGYPKHACWNMSLVLSGCILPLSLGA